jgi:superfamily I DNA/RNA helicase/mRNA-degrading endonuclease RelE of RelBE toxin-antitoxin system
MLNHNIRIAIAADFLDAFSKLPRQTQAKTNSFISKFKQNPTSSGINYESIHNATDKNLKSVRVDGSYRAIVLKPETGNTYLLLWVDNHDEAYQWAQKRVCKINPESGALQIIDVEEVAAIEREIAADFKASRQKRFADIRDRHLLRLGVPEELLPAVQAVVTDDDVDKLISKLPEEASDAILLLAAGYSLDDVLKLQDKQSDRQINIEDFDTALETDDSKRRFYIVEDDAELEEMLAAPLEKWRVFLHPTQRRLVEKDWNGAVRVLGGAGTGKTVVAMHRAKWLAEHRFTKPTDRIFFTTYTRNLAIDIENNLSKICSPEIMSRIFVENIDSWVINFLKQEGIKARIVYDNDLDELWSQAYTLAPEFSLAFYQDEWREVIQPYNVKTLKEYLKAPRVGRGTRLNRVKRAEVWHVFAEFNSLLQEKGWKDRQTAIRDACSLLKNKQGETLPFKAVIVDEAQDMGTEAFSLIRAMIPAGKNDLFIVGDPHQRIYQHKVTLSHSGIEIRGRSSRLRLNYRTTDEIRKWASQVLSGSTFDDLDGGQNDLNDYRSLLHGKEPLVKGFKTFNEEVEYLVDQLQRITQEENTLSGCCLILRTKSLIDSYSKALNALGITTCQIHRSQADDLTTPGLRVATMHRVKGLQFEYVLLAGLTKDELPPKRILDRLPDNRARLSLIESDRCLLHVAATRAKKEVLVTYYGQPSKLIELKNLYPEKNKN